jgi:hypothetical protein
MGLDGIGWLVIWLVKDRLLVLQHNHLQGDRVRIEVASDKELTEDRRMAESSGGLGKQITCREVLL